MSADFLSCSAATGLANRLLLGATLDSLKSYSLETSLILLKDDGSGGLLNATIAFVCSAYTDDCLLGEQDFFLLRSRFLANVYTLLGANISAVSVDDGGALIVSFGSRKVVLVPSEEHVGNDDAAWQIQIEQSGVGRQAKSLTCVNDDGDFLFVADGCE